MNLGVATSPPSGTGDKVQEEGGWWGGRGSVRTKAQMEQTTLKWLLETRTKKKKQFSEVGPNVPLN